MSKFERKMKRNAIRNEFSKFTQQWRNEKEFQNARLERGESLEKDENRLGRKPGFGLFAKRLKTYEAIQKAELKAKLMQKKEEDKKLDLEWKEE